jgi:hypothetical protein
MLRWRTAGVVVTLGLLVGGGAVMRVGASVLPSGSSAAPPKVLQLFYTPPVLVRAGERVRIPVDVVCATEAGEPCPATVAITVSAGGRIQSITGDAVKGLEFDVTAPAQRAIGSKGSGRVDFALTAIAGNRSVRLPANRGSMLSFYVTRTMPVVHVPAVPFGHVRKAETLLSLPWGSGPMRVGLSPGMESQTLGPSSFDVDRSGRIHLVDSLQNRVAVFDRGRLIRETRVDIGSRAALSVADDGREFVLDKADGSLAVTSISPAGAAGAQANLGAGIVSQIRSIGARTYANVLPLDAWIDVATGSVSAGMPVAGGQLIRVGREDSIRVGTVRGSEVTEAIDLRSDVTFGTVALAEPNQAGGYVIVAHTWREAPTPADQYQVIRIAADHSIRTFAVADRSFALAPPLAHFKLGPDGALYQMTSSPEGIRIVRFDLGEER